MVDNVLKTFSVQLSEGLSISYGSGYRFGPAYNAICY